MLSTANVVYYLTLLLPYLLPLSPHLNSALHHASTKETETTRENHQFPLLPQTTSGAPG